MTQRYGRVLVRSLMTPWFGGGILIALVTGLLLPTSWPIVHWAVMVLLPLGILDFLLARGAKQTRSPSERARWNREVPEPQLPRYLRRERDF